MDQLELAKDVLTQAGGIAKSAEFNARGLQNYALASLCEAGALVRIRHGYYCLVGDGSPLDEQILARLLPDGVVCLESALHHYGYGGRTPLEWALAFPRTVSRSRLKLDYPPVKPYFVQEEFYPLGKTTAALNGTELAIYDRERTICDCFRHRGKMDSEQFSKALHAYAADPAKNLGNLAQYARGMGLFEKISDLMGVMLGG